MGHNRLVERESQISLLDISLAQARSGTGQLVLLDGDAGAGKTCLLDAAAELAAARSMTVLSATADEFETDLGWGVVLQLFERPLARLAPDDRAGILHGPAAHAAALLTEGRTVDVRSDILAPDAAEHAAVRASAIHHSLYWVAANLAERTPLLLLVDDLQWADSPSVAFIAYLARRLEDLPVCVITATRSGVENGTTRARERIAREGRAHRVVPPALSLSAVGELVRAIRPTATDDLCVAVHNASGGNPFLVSVATSIIADAPTDPDAALATRLADEAPEDLLQAVDERLAALDDVTVAMARSLAVVGVRPSLEVAVAVSELGADDVRVALATLERHGFIRYDAAAPVDVTEGAARSEPTADPASSGRADVDGDGHDAVAFHPLIRTAIVQMTPPDQLAELHGRVVRVLGDLRRAPEEIAVHAFASRATGRAATVDVLVDAAERARRDGITDIALTLLRRAAAEPPTADQQPLVSALLARVAAVLGTPDLEELFERAITNAPDERTRRVLQFQAGRALLSQRRYSAAAEMLDAAVEGDDQRDPVFSSQLVAAQLSAIRFDPERRHEWQPRITALAERAVDREPSPDPALAAEIAYSYGATGSDFERAHRFALLAVDGESGVGLAFNDGFAWTTAMHALHQVNEYEIARSVAARVVARAQDVGSGGIFGMGSTYLAIMSLRLGHLTDALAAMSTIDRTFHTQMRILTALNSVTLAQTYLALGRLDDAAATLGAFDERLEESDLFAQGLPETWGWIHLANNDAERAVRVLSRMEEPRSTIGNLHPATTNWRSAYARALYATGATSKALELSDHELDLARAWGAPRSLGYALTTAGLLRPGRDGIALLDEAVAVLDKSQSRIRYGWALAERAHRRAELNQLAAARDDAREALGIAEQHHAALLSARAEAELRAAGGRPRRRATSGVESLTPAELRVAQVAAEGQSNAEIAAALFVSRKAVEFHLSNAYRKLGIRGRRDLSAALNRLSSC